MNLYMYSFCLIVLCISGCYMEHYKLEAVPNQRTSSNFRLIKRIDWLAQPPSQDISKLKTPVQYVIIWHTATSTCKDQASCTLLCRDIQAFHMKNRHWNDIGYSFLVGGDGNAYEGRGWSGVGAHTYGYNTKGIGIAFIGTFPKENAPAAQIAAAKNIIDIGVQQGYINKDYKLLGARQVSHTDSPGDVLFNEIKTWNNWSKNP